MKFQDFPYKRQDVEVIIKELEQLTNSFVEAKTANEQVKVIKNSIVYKMNLCLML